MRANDGWKVESEMNLEEHQACRGTRQTRDEEWGDLQGLDYRTCSLACRQRQDVGGASAGVERQVR